MWRGAFLKQFPIRAQGKEKQDDLQALPLHDIYTVLCLRLYLLII